MGGPFFVLFYGTNKYENHNAEPDIQALVKLADYFETTVDYPAGHMPPLDKPVFGEELELGREEYALVREYRSKEKKGQHSADLRK